MDKRAPYIPPEYSDSEVVAIQALAEGNADKDQQKRALDWIINQCCATYDMSYRPDNSRDTDFAEGKRFVGTQIVKLTKLKIGTLKKVS